MSQYQIVAKNNNKYPIDFNGTNQVIYNKKKGNSNFLLNKSKVSIDQIETQGEQNIFIISRIVQLVDELMRIIFNTIYYFLKEIEFLSKQFCSDEYT